MNRWQIWLSIGLIAGVVLWGLSTGPTHAQSAITCVADVTVQPGDSLSAIAARQSANQLTYQAIIAATNTKAATDRSYARNGYIVFRSDYRGHGFSEGEPTSSRGDPAYTNDVLNAVATLQRYADADPARIGMWGHSMGGLLTLRSMVTTKDVKVGVIWAGVVASYDELYRQRNPNPTPDPTPADPTTTQRRRWRQEMIDRFGEPEENPAAWAAISPNSYVSEISGPMQLHHGTADSDVPVEYSQTLNAQIASVGGVVEYYEYPGDNHNLSVNFSTAMARSIAFFDKYLK